MHGGHIPPQSIPSSSPLRKLSLQFGVEAEEDEIVGVEFGSFDVCDDSGCKVGNEKVTGIVVVLWAAEEGSTIKEPIVIPAGSQ